MATDTATAGGTTIRTIRDDELVAWFRSSSIAFMDTKVDPVALAEARRPFIELDRTLGSFVDGELVGTFRSFASELTLPGLARLPATAITAVTVRPTHRRRGLLTGMIEHDLRAAVERGEPLGILIAAEYPIYGRFGFGPATEHAVWRLDTRAARFLDTATGSVAIVGPDEARELLPPVHEAYRLAQPGEIPKKPQWWETDLGVRDPVAWPRWQGFLVVHRDPSGTADGYARIRFEDHWDERVPQNTLLVDELVATTPDARLGLWRFLAEYDLVATVKAENRPVGEPLPWLLADARAARQVMRADLLWVRVLDVERVLATRGYERDERLVLEVVDRLGGADGPAHGRFVLETGPDGASCRRTTEPADLALRADRLGAVVLGGTRLALAAAGGGVEERTPGALARADRLFRTADEPFCETWF